MMLLYGVHVCWWLVVASAPPSTPMLFQSGKNPMVKDWIYLRVLMV